MVSFSSTLDSTLESVDATEASVRSFAADAGFDESDTYFIGLAAREILVNAVKHGNRFDPNKKVDLRLSASVRELIVEIKDQGEGFRVEDVPDPRLPENLDRPSGRGLTLAKGIMDDFHIEANTPGGTYVRMSKLLPPSP
jgi:serine/threonine-protein kinase RsbW